jgi:hypothetical protein
MIDELLTTKSTKDSSSVVVVFVVKFSILFWLRFRRASYFTVI